MGKPTSYDIASGEILQHFATTHPFFLLYTTTSKSSKMAPHATDTNGNAVNNGEAPLEPGVSSKHAQDRAVNFPRPPVFEDKLEQREYMKGRLAAAFRIFGKNGFDEGVAGHITLRDPVNPDSFWVNPFGVSFSLMRKSDLIVSFCTEIWPPELTLASSSTTPAK